MQRYIRPMLILACGVILFLSLQIEAAQESRVRKPRSKANVSFTEKDSADLEKRREEIHRLILAGKDQREDVAGLLEIGNRTSIPVLLKVLKDNPALVRGNGRVFLPLKTVYAVEALRKITGLNMGATYKEWNDWWKKNQKYYVGK
jgi:hypothetical protein